MKFILHNNTPFVISDDFKKIIACEVTANTYKGSDEVYNAPKNIKAILSIMEVRAKLGIILVDGWSEKNKKIVKVTNKTASSIGNTLAIKNLTIYKEEVEKVVEDDIVIDDGTVIDDIGDLDQLPE